MISTQIRISGLNWSPEDYAAKFNVNGLKVWHLGDALKFGHKKRFRQDSGLAFSLPEQESWSSAQNAIRAELLTHAVVYIELFSKGVAVELSIGMTVGESAAFIQSIDFSAEFLGELYAARIGLLVTGYPTSDE